MSVSSVSDPPQSGTRPAEAVAPWQAAPDRVVEAYESATEGLGADEAQRRLDEVGPNRLREIEHRSVLEIL
ncbi:MAG: cation-transporting P-type ATPase, partial [Salinibacter sp.]|uniref:cation-transporting P-type ATPase n=1 Tax=Salinibacter sp. TaxID=2065818 RepID=UPI002FC35F3A